MAKSKNTAKYSTGPGAWVLEGVVVSDKMQKTAVVEVVRMVKHPKYHKFMKMRKRFKAENPDNVYKIGDRVRMHSCRPLSKDKHFSIVAKLGAVKGGLRDIVAVDAEDGEVGANS
ncbi:MAG: 30S ribosomal protein S17 [Candidatus Vogelbacteria bacterium CG10_big_fil_rev_8_21_14_0_10_51_16]|uniref:Small ribosomal subunit protein uS17 n=1 Tax=Candidatus Vogelbacteria bacterium CG10_big_fil_rev_8_21_14_0_10_51_16 TaxID=1975045 RepID=A0A2H0REU7_9BACT|nr:MAG: 30S ribosomal protein S17 [Candidatus Vogelbacteria bacterium CG10_big_fil_rev_8_21_14_0_10_51_16]